jgi:signal transduction histidine kinase
VSRRLLGPVGGSVLFVLIAALVFAGLGWVTVAALRVEDAQRKAAAEAQLATTLRDALWQLDGRMLHPLLTEDNRPFYHYLTDTNADDPTIYAPLLPAPLPDWMKLHVHLDPAAGWQSPQVPQPELAKQYKATCTFQQLRNMTPERAAALAELNAKFPAQHAVVLLAKGREVPPDSPPATTTPAAVTEGTINRPADPAAVPTEAPAPPGPAGAAPVSAETAKKAEGGRDYGYAAGPAAGSKDLGNGVADGLGRHRFGSGGVSRGMLLPNPDPVPPPRPAQPAPPQQQPVGQAEAKTGDANLVNNDARSQALRRGEEDANRAKQSTEYVAPGRMIGPRGNSYDPKFAGRNGATTNSTSPPAEMGNTTQAGTGVANPNGRLPEPTSGPILKAAPAKSEPTTLAMTQQPPGPPAAAPSVIPPPAPVPAAPAMPVNPATTAGKPTSPSATSLGVAGYAPNGTGGVGGGGLGGGLGAGIGGFGTGKPTAPPGGPVAAGGAAAPRAFDHDRALVEKEKVKKDPKETEQLDSYWLWGHQYYFEQQGRGRSESAADKAAAAKGMYKRIDEKDANQSGGFFGLQTVETIRARLAERRAAGEGKPRAAAEGRLADEPVREKADTDADGRPGEGPAEDRKAGLEVPPVLLGGIPAEPPGPPVAVHLGSMRPQWLTAADGTEVLVLARAARLGGKVVYQGVVLDWQKLQAVLKDEVKEQFPDARLVPVKDAAPPDRTMTALPVQLDPGPRPDPPPAGWTPLRIGLVLAWAAAVIAFAAVGLSGWSLIDLAERRIRFVSAVTHELRTPLTSLRLYLDLLLSGMVEDEQKRREYLATLNTESDRLHRLIDNVLDFARLERRRTHTTAQPVKVCDLLEQIRQTWADRCGSSGKELVAVCTYPTDGEVCTDPRLVQQVVGNLIDNARKYAKDAADPRIWLWAKPGGGRWVVFEVEDRGPGVTANERRSIFRPFRRGEAADTIAGGAGLGLALAKQWAEALGGRLTYRPADGGVGACFRLELRVRGC